MKSTVLGVLSVLMIASCGQGSGYLTEDVGSAQYEVTASDLSAVRHCEHHKECKKGEACVLQVGGPIIITPRVPSCMAHRTQCVSTGICSCLPKGEQAGNGPCHNAKTTNAEFCACNDGAL
jgi:hypothetical protein